MIAKDSFSNYNSIATTKNLQLNIDNEMLELNIPNDDGLFSPNRQNIQANVIVKKSECGGNTNQTKESCSPVHLSSSNKMAFQSKGAEEYNTK